MQAGPLKLDLTQFPKPFIIVICFLILFFLLFFFIKCITGKDLLWPIIRWICSKIFPRVKIRTIPNWIAECEPKEGKLQNSDHLPLDLGGQLLESLSFTVIPPTERGKTWRGGVMLGNQRALPWDVVDSVNAITCHVGEPPTIMDGIRATTYDPAHDRLHPLSGQVQLNERQISFLINFKNNHLKIEIEGQPVYNERIDPSLRRKAYLIAFSDSDTNKVEFKNTKWYTK